MNAFSYERGNYDLTDEDKGVLLRALSRGMASVNTLMPMIRDGEADSMSMYEREMGKYLDEEWEYMCREADEQAAAELAAFEEEQAWYDAHDPEYDW